MQNKILENIGLTRNESIIYLTLLKIGTAKSSEIVREAKLNSGKIYENLDMLKIKGLISETTLNNVKHFTAAPPNQLKEYVEQKREDLQKDETAINGILPELEQLRNISPKIQQAVIYTGMKGLKAAVEEAFSKTHSNDEMVSMGVTGKKDKKYNEFWKNFNAKREEKGNKLRYILSEKGDYAKALAKYKNTKIRYLTSFTPAAITVYGNQHVFIINYGDEPSCIYIQSEDTATSFKQFFNQLWKIAKA
jgi:sugar-specific transcriptional regulator TrmB